MNIKYKKIIFNDIIEIFFEIHVMEKIVKFRKKVVSK